MNENIFKNYFKNNQTSHSLDYYGLRQQSIKQELMPSYMTATKPTRDVIAQNRSHSLSSKNKFNSHTDSTKLLLQKRVIQLERQLEEYDFQRQANIVYNRQFRELGRMLGDESMEYEELRGKIEDMILQGPINGKIWQYSKSQVVAKDNNAFVFNDSIDENNHKQIQRTMSLLREELVQLRQDLLNQRKVKQSMKQQLVGYQQMEIIFKKQLGQLQEQLQSTRHQLQIKTQHQLQIKTQQISEMRQLQLRQNNDNSRQNSNNHYGQIYGQSSSHNQSNTNLNSHINMNSRINSNSHINIKSQYVQQQPSNFNYQQLEQLYNKTVNQYQLLSTKLYQYQQKLNNNQHQLQRYIQLQTNYDNKCNSLQKQLLQSKRVEATIKNETEVLKNKVIQYQKLLQHHQFNIQEKDNIIKQLNLNIDSYQTQIIDYQTQIKANQITITNYDTRIKDYQDKISQYESKIGQYESKISDYESRTSDNQSKISTLTQQTTRYLSEISTYQNNLATYTQQIHKKQLIIKQLQQSLTSTQQQYQQSITIQNKNITREHAITIKTLQSTLQATRQQLEIIRTKLIQNEQQLAQFTAEKFILQNQVRGKTLLMNTYKDKLGEYEDRMRQNQNRVKEQRQMMMRQHDESMKQLQLQITRMEQQLHNSKQHIEHLSQQLQQKQHYISVKQQQLNQLKQQQKQSQAAFQKQILSKQQQLHQTQQKLNQIISQLQTLKNQLSISQQQLVRKQQEIVKKQQEIVRREGQLLSKDEMIEELNGQIRQSKKNVNEQHQQIIKLGQYIDSLTVDIKNYQLREKHYIELNDLIKQSQSTLQHYKHEFLALSEQVHNKDLQIMKLTDQIEMMRKEIKNKQEELIQQWRIKNQKLAITISQQQQQLTALTQQLNQLIQKHTQFCQQHNQLIQQNHQLNQQYHQLTQQYRQLIQEQKQLKIKLQQKSIQVQKKTQQIQSKTQQIQNYKHLLISINSNVRNSTYDNVVNNSNKNIQTQSQPDIAICTKEQLKQKHYNQIDSGEKYDCMIDDVSQLQSNIAENSKIQNTLINQSQQQSPAVSNSTNNNRIQKVNQSQPQHNQLPIISQQKQQKKHQLAPENKSIHQKINDISNLEQQFLCSNQYYNANIIKFKQQLESNQNNSKSNINHTFSNTNSNDNNQNSQQLYESRRQISQQIFPNQANNNKVTTNANNRVFNKSLSVIVSSSNLQSHQDEDSNNGSSASVIVVSTEQINRIRRESPSPSKVSIRYGGMQSKVIYTNNTIVRNSSMSQEAIQFQQKGITSTYQQQNKQPLPIYSNKQMIEVHQSVKSTSTLQPVRQKQKRQSLINGLSNENIVTNKVSNERQSVRVMSSVHQPQLYSARNNQNDQTVPFSKTIHTAYNTNYSTRQSQFIITDNNITFRPSSRSISREREGKVRNSNRLNVIDVGNNNGLQQKRRLSKEQLIKQAMMNKEYAHITSSVANMNNTINSKTNNDSKYVFTQTKSPTKSIYPTATSPRFITSSAKQQPIRYPYNNINSNSHQSKSPQFNSLRQSAYSNNNTKIVNHRSGNNYQSELKEIRQPVVGFGCCSPESYDYKKAGLGNSQVGKFNVVKQKKTTPFVEQEHQRKIVQQQQKQIVFAKYQPTSFGQQTPQAFQSNKTKSLAQSMAQNNPFNNGTNINDSQDSSIEVMQRQDDDSFNCCKGG